MQSENLQSNRRLVDQMAFVWLQDWFKLQDLDRIMKIEYRLCDTDSVSFLVSKCKYQANGRYLMLGSHKKCARSIAVRSRRPLAKTAFNRVGN